MRELKRYISETLLFERRDKAWYRVVADVYSDLPHFVLQDLYSQERHGQSLKELVTKDLDDFDDDSFNKLRDKVVELWGERKSGQEILDYLLSGIKDSDYNKAIELIKSWERGETHWDNDISMYWKVKWQSKKPKIVNLNWWDISSDKISMWQKKYLSNESGFNVFGDGGSFTKTLRMFSSLNLNGKNEPVIFIIKNKSIDIIGGNNRTFNLFFKEYCNIQEITIEDLKLIKTEDDCRQLYSKFFDYVKRDDLTIKINCYIGEL